eukprot:6281526-Amphidinium_carterae.1
MCQLGGWQLPQANRGCIGITADTLMDYRFLWLPLVAALAMKRDWQIQRKQHMLVTASRPRDLLPQQRLCVTVDPRADADTMHFGHNILAANIA